MGMKVDFFDSRGEIRPCYIHGSGLDVPKPSDPQQKPSSTKAVPETTKQGSRMAPWVMWIIIGCLVVGVVILVTCIACCCCKRQAKQMQMVQYPLTPMASPRHRHRVVRTVRGPGMV